MTTTRKPYQFSLFQEETVSVQWVAKLLRRSESSVKRLLEEGKIRGYQHCPKGEWYILKSSVLEYEQRLLEACLPEKKEAQNGHERLHK